MARKQLYPPSVDAGFPVLPACPRGWHQTKFDEVFEVKTRPVKLDDDARYKLVVARRNRGGIELRSELQGREILTKTQFETHEGDFLISRRQIIHGACGVVPAHLHGAVVSGEYSTLRTKPDYDLDYFRHFSHSPYFQRTCFHSSHGVDIEKMIFKLDEWLIRPVQVPPLAEQRKIAAILSSVDEAIEKTQAVIDQVQVVKKGLMQELLTRGLPGRHEKFKQTEIGEIPASWEVVELQEIAEVRLGRQRSPSRATGPNMRPYVRAANIGWGGWKLSDVKHMDFTPAECETYYLRAGDILLNEASGSPAEVGKPAIWKNNIDDCCFQNTLLRVRLHDLRFVEFIYFYLLRDALTQRFAEDSEGTNIQHIGRKRLAEWKVPTMAIDEAERLCGILKAAEDACALDCESLVRLISLKQALISVLLTGELRVTP